MEHVPVNAGTREAGPDASSREAILLEVLDVPGLDTSRAKEDAAFELEGVVEFLRLGVGVCAFWVEPVH